MDKKFVCLSLMREDFEKKGYDASKLTDGQMEKIASKIGEAVMAQFWEEIDFYGEILNIPSQKIEEVEEENPYNKFQELERNPFFS